MCPPLTFLPLPFLGNFSKGRASRRLEAKAQLRCLTERGGGAASALFVG